MAALLLFSGCDNGEADAIGVIGGADGPTVVVVGEVSENEAFFCEMYADELYNKYNQYISDADAFNQAYYVENAEDFDKEAVIAAAEKCISTFEAIIAIEPPVSLAEYHQKVIEGAEYEIKYYDGYRRIASYYIGAEDLTDEEIEEISSFILEYDESGSTLFADAFSAAMEAAAL